MLICVVLWGAWEVLYVQICLFNNRSTRSIQLVNNSPQAAALPQSRATSGDWT